jgi:uncharacterized OB-fold protein
VEISVGRQKKVKTMVGAQGKNEIPIAENIFDWPSDDPHLIGTLDKATGRYAFPAIDHYQEADPERFEDVRLANRGKLWTFTVQRFPPKSPPYDGPATNETFQPFAVGYVELPGQLKVESRLTGCEPEEFKIGMEMELVIVKFREDVHGNDVMSFAFRPVSH